MQFKTHFKWNLNLTIRIAGYLKATSFTLISYSVLILTNKSHKNKKPISPCKNKKRTTIFTVIMCISHTIPIRTSMICMYWCLCQ